MYYNRTISENLSKLLEKGGELRWLYDFVKTHEELDFLIVNTKSNERILIYRGLTRIISIHLSHNPQEIYLDADKAYKNLLSTLYGKKNIKINFQNDIENLIYQIEKNRKFDRYYKNKQEGYYQNELSRKYGICGNPNDDFVIIDKEVVIGHSDKKEKNTILDAIRNKYKQLQREISIFDPKLYGNNLVAESIGDQLDFLALDKEGNLLLIELKHGTKTHKIYLSPLQIGMYTDIFTNFPKNDLECTVFEMLAQKQKIGLINPNWSKPSCIKNIIPVLIISEFNCKSSAKTLFDKILQLVRERLGSEFLNNLQTYNYTTKNGLSKW